MFVNNIARGGSVAANGAGLWTAPGLSPAVAVGDSVTARQTVNGVQSDPSAAVIVIAGTPVLTSIVVTPANQTLAAGATQAFTATGNYSDGSSSDISAQVVWLSEHPAFASISAAGLVFALDAGSSLISATKDAIAGSTQVTVTAPALASIVVTPGNPIILATGTQAFVATGILTDGTSQNLAGQVTWASSDPTKATIDPASGIATVGRRTVDHQRDEERDPRDDDADRPGQGRRSRRRRRPRSRAGRQFDSHCQREHRRDRDRRELLEVTSSKSRRGDDRVYHDHDRNGSGQQRRHRRPRSDAARSTTCTPFS